MGERLTQIDIEEGKKISILFSEVSPISRAMVSGYLSALRDKECVDSKREKELQKL